MILHDYQRRVIDDLWAWFSAHGEGHPIIEARLRKDMTPNLCPVQDQTK